MVLPIKAVLIGFAVLAGIIVVPLVGIWIKWQSGGSSSGQSAKIDVAALTANKNTSAESSKLVQPAVNSSPSVNASPENNLSLGGWEILRETHNTSDATEALGTPDQKAATVSPGGELAISLSAAHFFGNGSGGDVLVYGPREYRASYTIFVRDGTSGQWVHVDVNRRGFGASGFASHDIGHHGVQRASQVKIRNDDGSRNLFIDAIAIAYPDQMGAPAPSHHHQR